VTRAVLLLAMTALAACAQTPARVVPAPRAAEEVARPVPPPIAPSPDLASRLDAADAKLATFRTRTVWPSPGDREKWSADLEAAETRRSALAAMGPASAENAGEFAGVLTQLEGRVSLLTASDGVFRFGERARNPVR
jgi:hypothetical protein